VRRLSISRIYAGECQFHNNLGETYVLQGNLAGAQRAFLRRIQLHPDDAFAARTSLGVILIHEGRVDEGRRQLLTALRIYSQRAPRQDVMTADAYFMNRALALSGLGDPDSVAVWQEAISRRQIPAEDLADWKRYIDLLKTAPQPPAPVVSIAELLEVAGTTRPARKSSPICAPPTIIQRLPPGPNQLRTRSLYTCRVRSTRALIVPSR
jgi:hypothetical protein